MSPSSVVGGQNKLYQEGANLLLIMPPADRRRAQRKVLRTARVAVKIAEAILNDIRVEKSYKTCFHNSAIQEKKQ